MHSPPDLGPVRPGLALDLSRRCADCGCILSTETGQFVAPPGTGYDDNTLCGVCTRKLAEGILVGHNRAHRRRNAASTRLKGDRNRQRKRR